jgi:hypothetical protein
MRSDRKLDDSPVSPGGLKSSGRQLIDRGALHPFSFVRILAIAATQDGCVISDQAGAVLIKH